MADAATQTTTTPLLLPSEFKVIAKSLKEEISSIEVEIAPQLARIRFLNDRLATLEGFVDESEADTKPIVKKSSQLISLNNIGNFKIAYPIHGTWYEKAAYVLKEDAGVHYTVADIVTLIKKYEPSLAENARIGITNALNSRVGSEIDKIEDTIANKYAYTKKAPDVGAPK